MNYRKILVITLAISALIWRFFTWVSFDQIGYIGITKSELGIITRVSSDSPADKRRSFDRR